MGCFTRWIVSSIAVFAWFNFADGHSQAHSSTDLASRKMFIENGRRLLKNCIETDAGRELKERAITRRLEIMSDIRARRLDAGTALSTNHESNQTGLTSNTSSSDLFTNTPACLLEPEVTEGPYYVAGELIRSDLREGQPGIDLYVDLQFIDVNTCSPVNELYVDFWHANASGVYSGVVARTNGNSDDASNIDTTFHRGLSSTDSNGFVSFITKFPGLYAGRTTHIHIMTHSGGVVLDNGTYTNGRISHVGQLFFDQTLITEVQATSVYAENTIPVTTNEDDSIALQSASDDFDPFVQYAQLGNSVEDGLLSWISVGVDMTNDISVSAAGTFTGGGGVPTSGGGTITNSGSGSVADVSADSSASGDVGNGAIKREHFGGCALVLLYLLIM